MPEFEIQLRDVLLFGRHGVLSEESALGNQYRVNVRLRISASDFNLDNDSIESTVSYADLFEIVRNEMEKPSALLETVAFRIACKIKEKWAFLQSPVILKSGDIEIVKTVPPIQGMIGEAGVKYSF